MIDWAFFWASAMIWLSLAVCLISALLSLAELLLRILPVLVGLQLGILGPLKLKLKPRCAFGHTAAGLCGWLPSASALGLTQPELCATLRP